MRGCKLTILALAAFGALAARSVEAVDSLSAVYAFSWAGLDVGTLEILLETNGGDYRASWQAGTTGVIGVMFPFTSEGAAEGHREGARYLPSTYRGSSRWRDGGSEWRVAFAQDGRAMEIEVPAPDLAEREEVPPALRVGPDPASLALAAIARAAPGARLDGSSFDGRRAVAAALACDGGAEAAGAEELACTISGRLLAGASHRWRDRPRSDAESAPWRVWLRPGVQGGFWPVRLEAPSRFGTVGARLISVDRPPSAG